MSERYDALPTEWTSADRTITSDRVLFPDRRTRSIAQEPISGLRLMTCRTYSVDFLCFSMKGK